MILTFNYIVKISNQGRQTFDNNGDMTELYQTKWNHVRSVIYSLLHKDLSDKIKTRWFVSAITSEKLIALNKHSSRQYWSL